MNCKELAREASIRAKRDRFTRLALERIKTAYFRNQVAMEQYDYYKNHVVIN